MDKLMIDMIKLYVKSIGKPHIHESDVAAKNALVTRYSLKPIGTFTENEMHKTLFGEEL